jgi:hypothetical protein
MPGRDDFGWDALVVEVEQGLIVDADVVAARPLFEFLDIIKHGPVGVEEGVPGFPVTFDQSMPEEQLAAQLRVDGGIADLARGNDRDAVERDLLVGHRRTALTFPVRLAVAALDQVPGQGFHPLRLDPRGDPPPQP